jgi:ubiquitin carboxyl-terminal hydrolase 4/11/15
LKRFSNTGRFSLGGDKIDAFVDAPLRDLDLSGVVKGLSKKEDDSLIYDLYAISNHYGGLGGGHCMLSFLIV